MAIIDIANLSFTHIGGLKPIFDDVSLQLDTDWKLGLIGRNGYGKTTFLNHVIDHVMSIEKTKIVVQKGNYDTWQANKQLEDEFEFSQNRKLRREIRELKESSRQKANWSDQVEKTKIGSGPVDRGYIGRKSAKMMKRSKVLEKRYADKIERKAKLLKNIEKIERLQIKPLEHHANPIIEAKDLSIFYGDKQIFLPINFALNQGECLVISGVNGSGKSSVLKLLLSGRIKYQGEIKIASNLTISAVPQKFDQISGNLFDKIEEWGLDKTKFLNILRKLGFEREQFEKPVASYSSGQKKKVLLTKSLCEEAHVYIWDEPLNYIDIISRIQLENLILEYTPTMILVEHDQKFISAVATDLVELDLKTYND